MQYKLSVLIPSRSEEFLAKTIQDILENMSDQTEVIAVLDGQWASPSISQHPRVTVVYLPVSIGQRSATNLACRLSKAKYVLKVDAHCAFDKDWDLKMFEAFEKTGDNVTLVSTMRNLHCFDWLCKCGFTHYQDKGAICPQCGQKMEKKMIWEPRRGTRNYSYCFDSEPHFNYFRAFSERPEGRGDLTETMSLQGSAFMMTREKYWELGICDEAFGSWGSQGIEVAVKTWLSGGRVMVNHKTWYAHMFRTKSANGFGFPYPQSGKQVDNAKKMARDLFFNNKWDKAIRPLSWLVEKFQPIPGWSDEDIKKLKASEKTCYSIDNDKRPPLK